MTSETPAVSKDDKTSGMIARLGSRVGAFFEDDQLVPLEIWNDEICAQEVEFALKFEQAETVEDILRRRLGREYYPGHGLESLEQVKAMIKRYRPNADVDAQGDLYKERLQSVLHTLQDR